ncbi:MAG: translocation/assembly module TamB [Paludibacteraceae bacterium]|nr:translocation/assembly module TamB [Paludibacteraceae bacterium]
MALRSAQVQTAAVAILTDELSRAFGVDAHIDRVEIDPPLAMHLQGVFLSDQHGDTLLAVPQIKVRFNPFTLEQQRLCFPLVQLTQPTIHIVQDSATTNFDFLLHAFPSKPNKQPFSYSVECRKIELIGARVHYQHIPSSTDLVVSDIHTDLGVLYAGKDSLEASLRALHIKAQLLPIDGYVSADLQGDLDTLHANCMQVVYQGQQIFLGDATLSHLLQRDSLSAHLACTDLWVNAPLLTSLISDITHRPVQLPNVVTQLGNVHYKGCIDGQLDDLLLHGAFLTRVGTVSTDVHLLNKHLLTGSVRTTNLALGRLLRQPNIGRLSASLSVRDCDIQSLPTMQCSASVSALELKGYTYSNMHLQAAIHSDGYDVHLSVDDPNLQLLLGAHTTQLQSAPSLEVDIAAPKIDLAQLHLTDSASGHALSFNSTIRLHVDTTIRNLIDGTVGTIRFDSIVVKGLNHQMQVPNMDIVVQADNDARHMQITSPVLTAQIDGHFLWSTIPATIQTLIHRNIPSLVDAPANHDYTNDMDFSVQLLRMNDIMRVVTRKDISFPCVPTLTGFVHESDSLFAIRLTSDKVVQDNTEYQSMVLALDNHNPLRQTTGSYYIQQHIIEQDSTRLRIDDLMASVRLMAHNDSITTAIEFGPLDMADTVPDLLVHTTFSQVRGAPFIDVHFAPSDFRLGRAQWHIDDAHLNYLAADTMLMIHQLHVYTPSQMLWIDGKMSPHLSDSLNIQLQDVDLGYLLSATKVLDAIDFSGNITGLATLYGAFSTPQFEANLTMQDAAVNHVPLGCVTAKAELDRDNGQVLISGAAVKDSVRLADVTGRVITTTKPAAWEIYIDANGVPLNFIDFWTKDIVEQVEGQAYGRVHIFGHNRRTWVTTRAYAKDAALTIPATGCRYYFSDSVVLDTTYISFPAIHVRDAEGHQGLLSGRINHTCFSHFNFKLDAKCNKLLGLNLPASSGNMYYGRAYATGDVSLQGNEWLTRVDVNATTAENTDFYLSLATASNASSSEFITFRQPAGEGEDTVVSQALYRPQSRFLLNLAIEATPMAKIHLVLNEHNGDGIVGRGEGNVRLSMDATTGDVQMLGTYSLLNGTFSYTVGNLIHRDFTIAEGSTVTWSGDATNPQLDITAKYRCTASLRDLFGTESKQITSRSSIPVDCVVHITGEMNNMILKFGIEYPQSDESVAAQINAVINTEAMLMRQVVYLLIFNRFYTPDYMRASNPSAGINDAYSLLSSTVTGQINSWLSKLTSMVNVGFNMRADMNAGRQSVETEANIQIQPIDRLTINGNLGYRYNDLSNQPIFGDADIEYELTADGKLRAKVFTHSVDKYSLHQTGMQEGIGFVFRHDFNPGDAKKRREAKRNKEN